MSPVAALSSSVSHTMGCAISKVHSRIIDSSKPISSVDVQVVDTPNLQSYFTDDDNPNPKCIFIFGMYFVFKILKCVIFFYQNKKLY